MLSAQNFKYKTTCLLLWSNSYFSKIIVKWRLYLWVFYRTVFLKNSFLPYAIKEWNKLDPEIRNAKKYAVFQKMLLNFIRPIGNSTYKICDSLGINLLIRLPLCFSHLSKHITLLTHWILYVLILWTLSIRFIFILRSQNYTTLHFWIKMT